jgi:hypothetical protein
MLLHILHGPVNGGESFGEEFAKIEVVGTAKVVTTPAVLDETGKVTKPAVLRDRGREQPPGRPRGRGGQRGA